MKSVKRVFTKSLPRYNLRSRKSAVPVARNSTPKVNREVQASLSEEENCTLFIYLFIYLLQFNDTYNLLLTTYLH